MKSRGIFDATLFGHFSQSALLRILQSIVCRCYFIKHHLVKIIRSINVKTVRFLSDELFFYNNFFVIFLSYSWREMNYCLIYKKDCFISFIRAVLKIVFKSNFVRSCKSTLLPLNVATLIGLGYENNVQVNARPRRQHFCVELMQIQFGIYWKITFLKSKKYFCIFLLFLTLIFFKNNNNNTLRINDTINKSSTFFNRRKNTFFHISN